MTGVVAFIVGFLFALGLGFGGMTQPHVVRGFLDIFGAWDWRLLGVMAGAISIHAISYYFIMKRKTPLLDQKFHVPSMKHFDAKLFFGAMLFGLGWGWTGICPGPGIVSLASGQKEFFIFIISMIVGMKVFQLLESRKR